MAAGAKAAPVTQVARESISAASGAASGLVSSAARDEPVRARQITITVPSP
jgi:hypothetical protein